MSSAQRKWRVAFFAFQLVLVILVCLHETFWLLERHETVAPAMLDGLPSALLGSDTGSRSLIERAIDTYTNAAGIEVGYGYFAPNIPETHALIFECHYPDGHVDYQTPSVRSGEAELRLTSLIEQIGRADYDKWRGALIGMLVRSTWQQHPDAVTVRAFFGSIIPPTLEEFRSGKAKRAFKCLYVYDFGLDHSKDAQSTP